jgi:N-acetylglucosaminyldiphosphoundecaprenol N-acetyl-beta-D-mannosaminyltransferase
MAEQKKAILAHDAGAHSSSKPRTVNLLGINVSAIRMGQLMDTCREHINNRKGLLLAVANVAKVVNCRRNTELRKSLTEADIILADGLPLVWLSRLIGDPLPERVAGIDIMYQLLECASKNNYSIFLLGSEQEVLQKVVQVVRKAYPGVRIAGHRNGYFQQHEGREIAEQIKNSSADILFIGMSSPKKEIFLRAWRDFIDVPICHGVGGSFDVLAGRTKRAPLWMQKCGLEWLYRLIQEPSRMWKRYLVTNTIFIKLSLRAVLATRFSKLCRSLTHVAIPNTKKSNL